MPSEPAAAAARSRPAAPARSAPSIDASVLAALVALSLGAYLSTLCPTVFWYDSAEYSALAPVLGVPHPPGYPLYMWLGFLVTRLPVEPALAMNALSAGAGVLCIGLVHRVARELEIAPLPAAVGAASLAVSAVFWSNASMAESYLPGLAFALGALVLLLRGLRRGSADGAALAALVVGLGIGVHMSIATLGVGFAWLALAAAARAATAAAAGSAGPLLATATLRCAAALLGGLSVFLWIPLRDPSRIHRLEHWQWSWMMASGGTFWQKFDDPSMVEASLVTTLGNLPAQFNWIGVAVAAVGVVVLLLGRQRTAAIGLLLAAAGNLAFFHRYRVHDAEVFFLPAYAVCAVFIAAGCDGIGRLVGQASGRQVAASGVACVAFLLPAALGVQNFAAVDLSERTDARVYGEQLLEVLPEGSLVVKFDHHEEWKRFAVLLYFQLALGERPDVAIETGPSRSWLQCRFEAGYPLYALRRVPQLEELGYVLHDEGAAFRLALLDGAPAARARGAGDPPPACAARVAT